MTLLRSCRLYKTRCGSVMAGRCFVSFCSSTCSLYVARCRMCSSQDIRKTAQEIVHACSLLVFLSLPRLHPSSNEKALLLRSVRWHTLKRGLSRMLRSEGRCHEHSDPGGRAANYQASLRASLQQKRVKRVQGLAFRV